MVTKKTAKPSQAYKGNGNHAWESVVDVGYDRMRPCTIRLRVPGGYLYRVFGSGTTFVPMPEVVKHKV